MRSPHVAIVVTARSSWARTKTVVDALCASDARVSLLMVASTLLARFGDLNHELQATGYGGLVTDEIPVTLDGYSRLTSVRETGLLTGDLGLAFARLRPDVVVSIADRHETLATAIAASYQHLPLCHLQGGEITGSIDDKVRNAATALADYHCTATEDAWMRVCGRRTSGQVVWTGCPSLDLAAHAQRLPEIPLWPHGVFAERPLDLLKPFGILLYHPDTRIDEHGHMTAILAACARQDEVRQWLIGWPNADAGSDIIAKELRTTTHTHDRQFVRHVPAESFLCLLTQAVIVVGNSSVGIRECSFLGTPVVNIGDRQQGRERAGNVTDVAIDERAIAHAIQQQLDHGRYESSTLYGDGHAGPRVAEVLWQSMS